LREEGGDADLLAQTDRLRETLAQRHLVAPQLLAPQKCLQIPTKHKRFRSQGN
jgi:hypothetical protein